MSITKIEIHNLSIIMFIVIEKNKETKQVVKTATKRTLQVSKENEWQNHVNFYIFYESRSMKQTFEMRSQMSWGKMWSWTCDFYYKKHIYIGTNQIIIVQKWIIVSQPLHLSMSSLESYLRYFNYCYGSYYFNYIFLVEILWQL